MRSNGLHMNVRENRHLRRRQLLAWGPAAALAPALAACSAPVAPMRVGSIVFPGYEGMFLARELGLIDAQRVRLIELLANTDTLRALASEQLEAAAMTLDELMTARADGIDLRAVLVFDVSAGADVVLAKPQVTLKTLAGKRVAVEEGAMGAVMLSALLQAAGLTPDRIQQLPMTLDRSEEQFGRNEVDAVVTAEPWASRLEKQGAQRIFDSADIPGRIVDVLAVRAAALQSHGAALRHLLGAHFATLKILREAAPRTSAMMAWRLKTPASEVMQLYRGLDLPDLARNRNMLAAGGTVDQTAQSLQQVMLAAGLLQPQDALPSLTDASFLPP